jgi:probable O-glycosylation ligase (exosortase A-associated)
MRQKGRPEPCHAPMLDLFLLAFVFAFIGSGFRRPFVFVLAYTYIDIVAPQKVSWGVLQHLPISLIAFVCAFLAWAVADDKRGLRLSLRQALLVILLIYCSLTTQTADFPDNALDKWSWVWKALLFATFLPLTLRTRLRFEGLVLTMVLSVSVIVIGGAIKTLSSGGGYGELKLLVNDNTGLYEGSIISTVAIAVIPLSFWLAKHSTLFKPDWRVKLYAVAISFACLLMPIGTQARTGLICVGILVVMTLRTAKNRFLLIGLLCGAALVAMPLLPASFTNRMSTIGNHQADQSASTRVAVWKWTIDYVKQHPFGGGFEVYRANKLVIDKVDVEQDGSNINVSHEQIFDQARAFHSSYFEMLGEQGYPGLSLWLLLHLLGVIQMELVRQRFRRETDPQSQWIAPLANALQQAQVVYLFGSLFVGIAFQPFCYMLVGLQCGLWGYAGQVRRKARPIPMVRRPRPAPADTQPGQPLPQH